MQIKYLLFFLFFMTSSAFAFFCPNNFRQIELGYSIEQVEQECGKPDKKISKEITEEVAQSWDYYLSQPAFLNDGKPATGTLKTSVVFDATGTVINISVNGVAIGNTSVCGSEIQLGDTRDTVKAACGDPIFINKQTPSPSDKQKKHTITESDYGSNVLIFENGILKENK